MFTAPCGVEFADIDAYQRQINVGDARRQLGVDRDSTLVLSLGIMEPRKGQSVLARAWARINRRHPNAELALVGATDSPYCNGVRRYVAAAGIADSCRLVPPTSDPWAWHAAADFFVLSSDIESAPVVLAEAMAFETPPVATAVFGVAELIRNQRDGFLCEPNDVDDLARTLIASWASTRSSSGGSPSAAAGGRGNITIPIASLRGSRACSKAWRGTASGCRPGAERVSRPL